MPGMRNIQLIHVCGYYHKPTHSDPHSKKTLSFLIEYFFEIHQPFAVHTHDTNGGGIFPITVRIGIGSNRVIYFMNVDGQYTGIPVLLPGVPVELVKIMLPLTDEQKIHRIVEQIKPCFFIIPVQRSPYKLTAGILSIFGFVKCFPGVTGNQHHQQNKSGRGFQFLWYWFRRKEDLRPVRRFQLFYLSHKP